MAAGTFWQPRLLCREAKGSSVLLSSENRWEARICVRTHIHTHAQVPCKNKHSGCVCVCVCEGTCGCSCLQVPEVHKCKGEKYAVLAQWM